MKHFGAVVTLLVVFLSPVALADTWTDPDTKITWTYTVSDGNAMLGTGETHFSGCAIDSSTSGSVVLPSTLGDCPVTSIGRYAFYYCSGLTSVTIPSSVTSIGEYAFCDCSGLTSVTIPTSVTNIGESAFAYCSGLTSVTIPTSVTNIGDDVFYSCSKLTSVTIPSSVTSIGDCAFGDCSGLTSVTIPSSVTSIGDCAFESCSRLKSVTIPSSVTNIGEYAFSGCSKLTSVAIFDGVTNIGEYAFSGCSKLTSVAIPSSVTSIGRYAFYECSGLGEGVVVCDGWVLCVNGDCPTAVTIPTGTKGIVGGAFEDCSGLTSVTIPSSVTSIGSWAFYGCSGLGEGVVVCDGWVLCVNGDCPTAVTIPTGTTGIAGGAFFGCNGLTSVTIPGGVTSIGEDAFYSCDELTSVTIPEGVTSIGSSAFEWCSELTSVTIPSSVTSIGNGAFEYCSGLTTIYVDEDDATRVETLLTKSGFDCSSVAFKVLDPLPELVNPTPAEVKEVLEKAADPKLAEMITNATDYAAFRAWAETVKGSDGSAAAGHKAVMNSPHAWLSYALAGETLIETLPTAEEIVIEEFAPASESGKFNLTVSIKGITVGSAAQAENLERVIVLEGASVCDASGFSAENVNLACVAPEDGKVKFTASPKDAEATSFFMRVRVTP